MFSKKSSPSYITLVVTFTILIQHWLYIFVRFSYHSESLQSRLDYIFYLLWTTCCGMFLNLSRKAIVFAKNQSRWPKSKKVQYKSQLKSVISYKFPEFKTLERKFSHGCCNASYRISKNSSQKLKFEVCFDLYPS